MESSIENYLTSTNAAADPEIKVGRQVDASCEALDVTTREEIDLLQEEEVAPAGQGEIGDLLLLGREAETSNDESDDAKIHNGGRNRGR